MHIYISQPLYVLSTWLERTSLSSLLTVTDHSLRSETAGDRTQWLTRMSRDSVLTALSERLRRASSGMWMCWIGWGSVGAVTVAVVGGMYSELAMEPERDGVFSPGSLRLVVSGTEATEMVRWEVMGVWREVMAVIREVENTEDGSLRAFRVER